MAKTQAVFLDRDGVLNRERSYITRAQDLVLLPGSAAAVARLNASPYQAIVITNQSVIARGGCSEADLADIHNQLAALLAKEGASLDAVYYCPHHPDPGPTGNPAYAIGCECRKPGTGLVRRAAAEHNLELSASWMVGDTSTDIAMAKAAGMRAILVMSGYGGHDGKCLEVPDFIVPDLVGAVDIILGNPFAGG